MVYKKVINKVGLLLASCFLLVSANSYAIDGTVENLTALTQKAKTGAPVNCKRFDSVFQSCDMGSVRQNGSVSLPSNDAQMNGFLENMPTPNMKSPDTQVNLPSGGQYSSSVSNPFVFCSGGRPSRRNPMRKVYDRICPKSDETSEKLMRESGNEQFAGIAKQLDQNSSQYGKQSRDFYNKLQNEDRLRRLEKYENNQNGIYQYVSKVPDSNVDWEPYKVDASRELNKQQEFNKLKPGVNPNVSSTEVNSASSRRGGGNGGNSAGFK